MNRLKKELPLWIEKGWISSEHGRAILGDLAVRAETGPRRLPLAFSILGVVLLGSGIITFFAANWSEMGKLTKLLVLFGGMWSAYLASGHFLKKGDMPHIGKALLLLGVILFGSNIMLVAQIYHIDSHYPDGVMLWSFGGILTACLMNSHPVMAASLMLASLWTAMESFGFSTTFHWPFLVVVALCLPIIIRSNWLQALKVALAGVMLWCLFSYGTMISYGSGWPRGSGLYLVQLYAIIFLALFIAGMIMKNYKTLAFFSDAVEHYAAFATLSSFHFLTYPRLAANHTAFDGIDHGLISNLWVLSTLAALSVAGAFAFWHRHVTGGVKRPTYLKWGEGLLYFAVILIVINLFSAGKHSAVIAVLFNVLFFAGLAWLIYAAMHNADRTLVNIAFFFFAATLFARYFDTFWSLMNRSFFFIIGGLLLTGVGYLMEGQRRKITDGITAKRRQGEFGES